MSLETSGSRPDVGNESTSRNEQSNKNETETAAVKVRDFGLLNEASPDRNQNAETVLDGYNFEVKSVEELINIQKDPQKTGPQKERGKQIYYSLGKAVYIVMSTDSDQKIQEAAIAGPFSTEKCLPEKFKGLGGGVYENFGNKEIRNIATFIDYVKNNSQKYSEEFLLKKVKTSYQLLDAVGTSNLEELEAKADLSQYFDDLILSLETKLIPKKQSEQNGENNIYMEPPVIEPENNSEDNGSPRERRRGFIYGPDKRVFADQLMDGERTSLRVDTPPDWYEKLSAKEQGLVKIMVALNNMHVAKDALGVEPEKLALMYVKLNFSGNMFDAFYGDAQVKKALETFVGDLFQYNENENGGLLTLKTGEEINETFKNFGAYKEKIAWKIEDPSLTDGQIDANLKEDKYAYNQMVRMKVASAWSFIYYSNLVESADVDKKLIPGGPVSDKLRTTFYPLKKIFSKLNVSADDYTHEEELTGGSVGSWIKYNIRDKKFRDKLNSAVNGDETDGTVTPFPKRLGVSFLDLFPVASDGEKISLAKALAEKKDVDKIENDFNIFAKYKDVLDGASTIYNYVIGKMPLNLTNNKQEWETNFYNALSLLRQNKLGGTRQLEVVEAKIENLMTYVIANSVGVYPGAPELLLTFPEVVYGDRVKGIVNSPTFKDILDNDQREKIIGNLKAKGIFARVVRENLRRQANRANT